MIPTTTAGVPNAVRPTTWTRTWPRVGTAAWLVVLAVSVAVVVKAAPTQFRQSADLTDPQIADPERLRAGLRDLGITPWTLTMCQAVGDSLSSLLTIVVSFFLVRSSRTTLATIGAIGLTAMTAAVYPPSIPDVFPGQPVWVGLARIVTVIGMTFFFTLAFVFPTGRFVPRSSIVALPVALVGVATFAFFPDVRLGGSRSGLIDGVTTITLAASAVAAQIYRYRKVSGLVERQQIKWVVFGITIAIGGFVMGDTALGSIGDGSGGVFALVVFLVVMPVLSAALPVSLALAILRRRLFDVDIVISRTVVYATLTGLVVATYALVVVGFGELIGAHDNLVLSLLATGLIAVGFQPLRMSVQRLVNRMLFGDRDDPYSVLSRLARRLEGTIAPSAVLPAVISALTDALRLPYAAISVFDGRGPPRSFAAGTPGPTMLTFPLVYGAEPVGELVVAPRAAGEAFSAADRRLLEDLARQAGIAANALRLGAELQVARERLVAAREEERRRLRRDLHDGLGSQLSALAIQTGAMRTQIRSSPDAAETAATELGAQLRASVAEIRRLVDGLRPASLDELGLVGAVCERARRFDGAVRIHVDAPDQLPPFPAATEVAVFRIVDEALTNVTRHAGATRCDVVIRHAGEAVTVLIVDDGCGIPANRTAGVGLASMRERADELGGRCVIGPGPNAGTAVEVELPVTTL